MRTLVLKGMLQDLWLKMNIYPVLSRIRRASYHMEYWIPAEELAEFNRHIVGEIEVIQTFE